MISLIKKIITKEFRHNFVHKKYKIELKLKYPYTRIKIQLFLLVYLY